MEIKTKRLSIERVRQQNITELTPLLKYQSLFQQAGLVTVGKVDLVSLRMLAQTECLLQIRERSRQRLLGLIVLLHSYDKTGVALVGQYEVGYLLLPQEQHQGYMTEGLNAVCNQLRHSQITVIAEVKGDNSSSIGVLKRCNFIRTTTTSGMIELWKR
ncbi:GNAT family N-acetyltransferase [Limosilactobacillus portuensis]|uniref:GNAT family N-acetyltransferase n=1 Tax=Limosilactobacillus portuensis TaxID=2742601 RepID=UPI003D732DC8